MTNPIIPDSYFPRMPGFVSGTHQPYTCRVYFHIDQPSSSSTMVWRVRKFVNNSIMDDYTEQDIEMEIKGKEGALFHLEFLVSPDCVYQYFRAGYEPRDTCVAEPVIVSTVGYYE